MKAFRDKRSVFWLTGVGLAIVALFLAFVVAPLRSPIEGAGGATVDVPKMENVPPPGAERMRLETDREQ